MRRDKPRLLHVITRAEVRGAERAGTSLSEQLATRGWTSRAVALAAARRGSAALEVPALSRSHPLSLRSLTGLRRLARSYDLVIAHGSSTLPACAMALRGTGVPFVYVNIGDPRFWAASWHRRLRVRTALGQAAAVVALSDAARHIYLHEFRLAAKTVAVIPNHRSAETFRPSLEDERAARREQLGLTRDDFLVVYLGALAQEKRVDVAIDAVAEIDDVTFWIAGTGPEASRLRRQAARLGDRVRLLGAVADPAGLLAVADCLVLTSDSEGMPGVLIEAGLSGVPCVATDVGWVREIIIDGATGALARPDNPSDVAAALRRVRRDAESLSSQAVEHCLANFDTEVALDRWERLVETLLPKP